MSHIVIFGLTVTGNESGDSLYVAGSARCSGMSQNDASISWGAVVDPSSSAASITAALKDAAIQAAFDQYEITVGLLDKKTIIGGGALGL